MNEEPRLLGVSHSTWCVFANLAYLGLLLALPCVICAIWLSFSWWQVALVAVALFFPVGYFVDHNAHGCYVINWFFDMAGIPRA